MTEQLWGAVEAYINDLFIPPDEALELALENNEKAQLPPISVEPALGKFLMILATIQGAKSILEVGTLGGYSTIWLARALPADGHLITLELEPTHAEVARENITRAGVMDKVEIIVGDASKSLEKMAQTSPQFDFIFIDADKESNATYFQYALQFSHPGTVIFVDNVIRGGAVIDANHADSRIHGVRKLNEMVAAEPRVLATELQTVSGKSYDGFMLARVLE